MSSRAVGVAGALVSDGPSKDELIHRTANDYRALREARLRGRGDREDVIARRLALAPEEERVGRELADHIVVNDDLSRAIGEVAAILESRRQ